MEPTQYTAEIELAVVIPCYNEEENIRQVVESYNNQNCKDFMLILVDNNSTDNTSKILEECQNVLPLNIVRLIETEQGVSAARKCGYNYCINNGIKYVISADADTTVGPQFVQKYYTAFFVDGLQVISGESNWDCSSQIPFENIKQLLQNKHTVEDMIVSIYDDKTDGFNSGFSIEAYQEVGGIDIMKYLYRDKIYASASDDWCLHAKFLRAGYFVESVDTTNDVTVNFRKYLTSINNMLEGTLYDKDWQNLNAQEKIQYDISDKDSDTLFQKFSRSAIVNFMLMHCYLADDLLLTKGSIDLLGSELTTSIYDKIAELKEIYPYNKYNDASSYFSPAIHLFFIFGKQIIDRINHYMTYKNVPTLKYIEYPRIDKVKKKNNLNMSTSLDDQLLYLLCTNEEVFSFFSEN